MKCVRKVSQIEAFVKGFEQQPWWVGLDVHKNSYAVALRRADGHIHTWTSPPDPYALLGTFERCGIHPVTVVQEAGPTGYHLPRVLQDAGIDVRVGAPSKIPRSVTAGAKSDRLDCRRLADYAARDMVQGIAIPTREEEMFRGLVRQRRLLTYQVRKSKQRIRALMLYYEDGVGLELPSWNQQHRDVLLALDLPLALRFLLESHFTALASVEENRSGIDTRIDIIVRMNSLWEQRRDMLMTMPGVGPCISTTFLAELFRPERFGRGEEVSSYLGLAPMVHHSGEKTPRGRLRPVGQKYLRSLIVEAAWSMKARDPGMGAIYNKVLSRTGIAQKAIVAVARRMSVIMWRILLEIRPYYPMPTARNDPE